MYTQNSGYGQAILNMVSQMVPTFGRIFIVCSPSDVAKENYLRMQEICKSDPDGQLRFFGTNGYDDSTPLEQAYAAATTNNNDVILLDANTVHKVTTQISWSKSRVHLIGMDGGGRFTEQGARIQTAVGAAVASVVKVTGTRNSFRNIKFVQNDTNAAAINVVISAGSSTLWQNCSFIFEVTDNLDLTTACEVLIGEAGGTFDKCVFGNDCILSSAARSVTTLDTVTGSASSDSAKHNTFRDCMWTIQSSSASAKFFSVADTAGAKFRNTLINPVFQAVVNATNSAVILTATMASVSGLVEGNILVVNPATNCTDLCTTSDNVKAVGSSMNGGADTAYVGIGIVPA
uniref:Pectinesterase n=1 Tax=viral metagenome TaxID=1070528 RepID=A0A6H1ZI64_9ZZZZ